MGLSERAKTLEQQMIVTAKQKVLSATSWFIPAELARLTEISAPDLRCSIARMEGNENAF